MLRIWWNSAPPCWAGSSKSCNCLHCGYLVKQRHYTGHDYILCCNSVHCGVISEAVRQVACSSSIGCNSVHCGSLVKQRQHVEQVHLIGCNCNHCDVFGVAARHITWQVHLIVATVFIVCIWWSSAQACWARSNNWMQQCLLCLIWWSWAPRCLAH